MTQKQPGSGKKEPQMEEMYPPNNKKPYPVLSYPATIVDIHGNILVWYLPNSILNARQVSLLSRIAISVFTNSTVEASLGYILTAQSRA